MTKLLTAITLKLEEINKLVDDLRQELKSSYDNAHVTAGGKTDDAPPENQAPPSSERDQVPRPVLPEVESPFRYSRTSVEMRGVQAAVESHVNIPRKWNPPVFSCEFSDFLSFRKQALVFAEYVGVGDGFTRLRQIPAADLSTSAQQIRDSDCTNDEIDLHRKAYQFLRSALKTKKVGQTMCTELVSLPKHRYTFSHGTTLKLSPRSSPFITGFRISL